MHNVSVLFDNASDQHDPEEESSRPAPVTSLRRAIEAFDFCVVDLETTGMGPQRGSEIIEIGAVRIEDGELTETFQQLIEPRRSIPPNITELTGITNKMVTGKPSVHDVLPDFVRFLDDAIMLAHNFTFDFSFLDHYHSEDFYNDHICTVKLARNVADYRSNALDFLNEHLSLNREEAHRALDDAVATGKLFRILTEKVTDPEDFHRGGLPPCLQQINPGALVMNVDGVGKSKANRIDGAFSHTLDLLSASQEQLQQLSGIGPALSQSIHSFTSQFSPVTPGRKRPVKLDREQRDEYDQHHRDREPSPDEFVRQTR